MSRAIKDDFLTMQVYFNNLSSKDLINSNMLSYLSGIHKKYFCLLLLLNEIKHASDSIKAHVSKVAEDYLVESISDIGTAIFTMIYGLYKSSRMSERSSIESILKFIGYDQNNEIISRKNVFEVFDIAATNPLFSGRKNHLSKLKQLYGQLCSTSHTSDLSKMEKITFMSNIPSYNDKKFLELSNEVGKLMTIYLELVILKYPDIYFNIHYSNMQTLNSSLPRSFKRKLLLGATA